MEPNEFNDRDGRRREQAAAVISVGLGRGVQMLGLIVVGGIAAAAGQGMWSRRGRR